MPQSPFAPLESTRQRWQFSIRGMLIFTLSVAVGASVSQINLSSWVAYLSLDLFHEYNVPTDIKTGFFGGMIATVIFWFCFGLFHQIRDLKVWLTAHSDLDSEQKWGARCEMIWRICLLILLILYAWMVFLVDMKTLDLPEPGIRFWKTAEMFREAILVLLLLILVGSVPTAWPKKYWAVLAYLLQAALGVIILRYFLMCLLDDMSVCRVVEIAVHGINNSCSLQFTLNNAILCCRYSRIFFWWTFASGIAFAFNYYFLGKLARQWNAGIGQRLFWLIPLALGTVNTTVFAIWILAYGYPQISPYFAEFRGPIMVHCWIAIVVLTTLLASVSAYRMAAEWKEPPAISAESWRRNAGKYYHEWRLALLLFGGALVGLLMEIFYYQSTVPGLGYSDISTWSIKQPPGFFLRFLPVWLNGRPVNYLWLGLLLLVLHRAFSRRSDRERNQPELPHINPKKFLVLWLLSSAVILSGLFALAWMSFAVWYNPWYIGR